MRTWQWGWRNSIFPKLSFRETFYYEIRNPTNRETIEEINIKNTSWNFWNRKAIEISRSENATNEMRRPDKPLQNLPQHLNESQMDRLSLLPQRPKSSILSTDPKLKKWENALEDQQILIIGPNGCQTKPKVWQSIYNWGVWNPLYPKLPLIWLTHLKIFTYSCYVLIPKKLI